MGERHQRWRTRLRSDRAENIFGVILMVLLSGAAIGLTASWLPSVVWSAAWPAMATYTAGCLAAGTVLALLVPRWPSRWMRAVRSLGRGQHWALNAMWIPLGLVFFVSPAPGFAEGFVCERGDGVLVQTSWTDTDEANGIKTGVYTHDGETHEIVVAVEEWVVRQAGPEEPPTEDNPYYTRTYRVPWAGSSAVCGNAGSSDKNDLVAMGVTGVLAAAAAVAALLELLRRRRRGDELVAGPRSSRA